MNATDVDHFFSPQKNMFQNRIQYWLLRLRTYLCISILTHIMYLLSLRVASYRIANCELDLNHSDSSLSGDEEMKLIRG